MEIPKLIRKLAGLYKLAVGQAGKPEGDNARRQMDKMLENSSVKITDDMLASHEVLCECSSDWDGDLAQVVAMITRTDCAQLKIGKIRFRGTRVSVEEAERNYNKLRDAMYRISAFAVLGYMAGSFGEDVLDEYMNSVPTRSESKPADEATIKSRMHEVFSREATDAEGELAEAAGLAGSKDPVKLWESLKA